MTTWSSKWYVQVNDEIGGWIVTTLDMPYSAHDHRRRADIRPCDPPAGPRGYVIAECVTQRDAITIAGLLNMEGIQVEIPEP